MPAEWVELAELVTRRQVRVFPVARAVVVVMLDLEVPVVLAEMPTAVPTAMVGQAVSAAPQAQVGQAAQAVGQHSARPEAWVELVELWAYEVLVVLVALPEQAELVVLLGQMVHKARRAWVAPEAPEAPALMEL